MFLQQICPHSLFSLPGKAFDTTFLFLSGGCEFDPRCTPFLCKYASPVTLITFRLHNTLFNPRHCPSSRESGYGAFSNLNMIRLSLWLNMKFRLNGHCLNKRARVTAHATCLPDQEGEELRRIRFTQTAAVWKSIDFRPSTVKDCANSVQLGAVTQRLPEPRLQRILVLSAT
jgi:hypothetical protein